MDKNVGKNKAYVCFTCSAHFDSPRKLRLHFEDTLHQPKSKLKVFIPEITMPSKNSALKDYMKRKFRDPVIGLEHVVEYRAYVDDKKEIVVEYICELCKFHSGSERMMLHLTGLRHTKIVMAKKYPYILKAQLRENEDKTQFLRQMARQIERSEGTKTYRVDAASNEKILRKYRIPALKEKREKKRKVRWDERENSEILRKTALEYLDNFEIDSDTETANFTKLTQKLAWDLRVYALRADPNTPFPDTIMKANELALSIIESDNSKKPKKFHIVSEEKKPLNSEGADRTQREVQTEHGAAATRNSMKGKGPSITVAREPETAGYTAERGWTESEAQMRFGTSRRSMEEEHISFTLAQGTAETAERSWAKTEFQTRLGLAGSSMQEEYTAAHYGFMAPEMLDNSSGSGGDIRSSQKPVLQGAYFPANIPHPDDKYKMAETPVNQSTQYRAHFLSQQNVEKGPTLPKFTKSAQKETVPQSSQDTQLLLDSVPQKDVKMEDITFFKQLVGLMAALPQNKSATEKIAMDPKLMLFKALLQNRTTNTESIQNNLKLLMQMPSLTPANKSTENIQLIQKLLMINASQAQSNQSKDDVYFNQKLMLTGQQAPSSTQNILFNQMMITTTVDQNAANLENPQLNPNSVLQTGTVVQNNQSAESIQPIQNQVVHMPSLINQHSLSQVNPGYQNTQTLYSEAYDINMQGQQGYVNTAQNYGVGAYGKSQESTPDYMSYQGSYGTQYNDANGNAVGIPTYTSSENPQNQYQNMSFSSEMYLRNSEWKATYGQSYSEQSPVTLAQDPSLYNQEKQHTAPYSTVRLTPSVANMSQESQISRLQETTYSKREREDKYFVPQSDEWIQQQSSLKMRHDNGFYKSRPPSYSSTRKYCKDETRAQDRGLARSDSQHVKRARLDTDQVPSYRSNSAKGSSCRSKETSELLGLNTEGLPKEILKRIQGKDLFTASAIISEYKESLH